MPFYSMLINQVNVATVSGVDLYGRDNVVTTASGVPARVMYGNRLVLGFQGEQLVADATVYLPAGTALEAGDRLAFEGSTLKVLQVVRRQDESGTHHIQALAQTWRTSAS